MRAVRGAMREMRAEETADASSAEGRERAFQQVEGETAGEERAERMKIWRERYTKYEKARIIGARALQIAMGAPILINTDKTDPIEIAIEEFERGVIPITVRRRKYAGTVNPLFRGLEASPPPDPLFPFNLSSLHPLLSSLAPFTHLSFFSPSRL